MNPQALERLNRHIESTIPLARAAGIRLAAGADDSLVAHAPQAANGNPHGSIFGGSLYVTALVAGYAQTACLLDGAGIEATTVIQHAEAEYLHPLHGDICARIDPIDANKRARFIKTVRRHGRGRLDLTIYIANARIRVFELHARFAAIAPAAGATAAAGAF